MLLLPIYAVIVWYLTFRLRRTWWALLLPIAAAAAVMLVLTLVRSISGGRPSDGVSITLVLYAEAAIVLAVGVFIAVLPRPPRFAHCPYCFYDLRGLETTDAEFPCPECGMPAHGYVGRRSPAPESPDDAREQDRAGDDREQQPREP